MVIKIPIVSTLNDKGFKAADSAMKGLIPSAAKMGAAVGAALSVGAIAAFGKASVSAFLAEDKAAKILGQTLKNLGLGFQTGAMNDYISKMAEATGVSKDELRPAFDRLARITGSTAKAQELLNLSMDISAGTGKDLASVSASVAKAYGGQTAALGRLGLGLTAVELHSKNFGLIQERLTRLFNGDAKVAADSYAGQVSRLGIAFDEMKIKIGGGIVDGLASLGKDKSLSSLTKQMDDFGTSIGNASHGLGIILSKLDSSSSKPNWFSSLLSGTLRVVKDINPLQWGYDALVHSGASATDKANHREHGGNGLPAGAAMMLASRAAADAAKAQKEQLSALKKSANQQAIQNRLTADSARLQKSQAIQNMALIEITAALKGKISASDKLSLEIQQTQLELQQAIQDKNVGLADQLAAKLDALQGKQSSLNTGLAAIKEITDPTTKLLAGLNASLATLLGVQAAMAAINNTTIAPKQINSLDGNNPGLIDSTTKAAAVAAAMANGGYGAGNGAGQIPNSALTVNPVATPTTYSDANGSGTSSSSGGSGTPVQLILDGKVVAETIIPHIVNYSASGTNTSWNRNFTPGAIL
jgi:hypothetical protein